MIFQLQLPVKMPIYSWEDLVAKGWASKVSEKKRKKGLHKAQWKNFCREKTSVRGGEG